MLLLLGFCLPCCHELLQSPPVFPFLGLPVAFLDLPVFSPLRISGFRVEVYFLARLPSSFAALVEIPISTPTSLQLNPSARSLSASARRLSASSARCWRCSAMRLLRRPLSRSCRRSWITSLGASARSSGQSSGVMSSDPPSQSRRVSARKA